jgi:transposase-like protein
MVLVLEDYAELRDMHPRASVDELAPRMGMTPAALQRAVQRARQRARANQPIPGPPVFPTPKELLMPDPFPPAGQAPTDDQRSDDQVAAYAEHTAVRGELFKPSGKWAYSVKLDYSDTAAIAAASGYVDPAVAAAHALRTATARGTSEVTVVELGAYWTLVVPDPPNGWPIMVRPT